MFCFLAYVKIDMFTEDNVHIIVDVTNQKSMYHSLVFEKQNKQRITQEDGR